VESCKHSLITLPVLALPSLENPFYLFFFFLFFLFIYLFIIHLFVNMDKETALGILFIIIIFYSHVHTLFGSFLPPAPFFHPLPPYPLISRQVMFCL
jgi:hypothetical protein